MRRLPVSEAFSVPFTDEVVMASWTTACVVASDIWSRAVVFTFDRASHAAW
jgi:hypothetical protein